jgi:sugar phosphate isomerase/epimerase
VNRLGIDVFSLRRQGWDAFEMLEYAARQGAEHLHFSEPRFLGPLEPGHLGRVRDAAARLGLALEIGMLSICPTSGLFDPGQGPAEEQVRRMLAAAHMVGSPLLRVVMGNRFDRRGRVPLEAHIAAAVDVLRAVREDALASGVRIAVENHAGDLRASELETLVKAAGADFVGVCLDAGNLPMTFDSLAAALERLAPYVLTSHIRDTRVWRSPSGFAVEWVPAGEGNVGFEPFLRRFAGLLPGRPMSIETIVIEPRALDFREPGFWDGFPSLPAVDFARYLEIAEQSGPPPQPSALPYDSPDRERQALESTLRYCRRVLSS